MNTKTPEIIIKSSKTLTLKKNPTIGIDLKPVEPSTLTEASPVLVSSTPQKKINKETPARVHNFNGIYRKLHNKFPAIIDLDKPVLLAVGIRKAITEATGISGVVLKKWIAWYCRKSKYYDLHEVGATRFNLDGTEAGIVTEEHQEHRDKYLEQVKKFQTRAVDKKDLNEAGEQCNT